MTEPSTEATSSTSSPGDGSRAIRAPRTSTTEAGTTSSGGAPVSAAYAKVSCSRNGLPPVRSRNAAGSTSSPAAAASAWMSDSVSPSSSSRTTPRRASRARVAVSPGVEAGLLVATMSTGACIARPVSSTSSDWEAASAQCRSSKTTTSGAWRATDSRSSAISSVCRQRAMALSAPGVSSPPASSAASSGARGTSRPSARRTETHGHSAGAPSSSLPWVHTSRHPRPTRSSAVARASRVLPMPASPTSTHVVARPDSAAWAAASRTARARPRPTIR